jgi:hypothetical protein
MIERIANDHLARGNDRKKPNLKEARRQCDAIAGRDDPPMTFQAFDDKGTDFTKAGVQHGKLSDPEVQKWLITKSKNGCGIFVTISKCDGKGRKRSNVRFGRACFVDLDGKPLPTTWAIKPDFIGQTSKGKFHVYWFIDPTDDLNAWSDCQARLASYYGGDPRVIDPPRVLRLVGFDHLKGEPYRSHIIHCENVPLPFRRGLDDIVAAHVCEYKSPAPRENGGRSDNTGSGEFDAPEDIERAREYLANVETPEEGQRNNVAYRVACVLDDFGISSDESFNLMTEIWNPRLDLPLPDNEIRHVCKSAPRYKVSAAGSKSVANTADEFEDIAEPTKTENFTDLRIHVERGTDITPKPINWLWLNRFPVGKMTLVAGFLDQGKSQVMLKIAATISTGGDWPDGSGSVDEGVVIIVSSEDDAADTLLPRFMAAREKRENILIVKSIVREKRNGKNTTRVFNVADDLGQVSEVIRREAANGRTVRMVGFDPLNAYFGGPLKADSHKNADMRALLTPIAEWAARLKIATVGIMHFNKGGNGHALYRITDSLAISASARAAWFCVEDQESGDHLFIQGKKNLSKGVAGLTYSIAEPTLAKAESVHLMSYGATLRQRPPTKLWPLSVSESRKRSTPLCANLKHF